MNDGAILRGQLTVVAVAPDVIELSKISAVVFTTVFIVPEANGHTGERPPAHQFAFAALQRRSILIPELDRHTQGTALNLACVDRSSGTAAHKARNDVGTTRNRSK